ncbi:rhodanese-like domain-containing protein [Sutcliffiella horikoshii]|uniref:rhodanese-like domain-containing protein n=1 Tax=Sutcliffiella horikoshii TaxID=79883 RepID=UPI001F3E6C54|nr:rhodanese-like domain-containing protein [Sutcliffiella horikoshii]
MMLLLFFVFTLAVSIYLFKRYVPVLGVPCLKAIEHIKNDIKIVDVRDFNYVQGIFPNSINIPVAYLQRNYKELNGESVIVVASSHLEKNISIRFLMRKGIKVVGYEVVGRSCKCPKLNMV